MHLRSELSEAQRSCEPRNADAHLAFITLGLNNCVVYGRGSDSPVHLIDLDGTYNGIHRKRTAEVIGFNASECVEESVLEVPEPGRDRTSLNLFEVVPDLRGRIARIIALHRVRRGMVTLELAEDEHHAG